MQQTEDKIRAALLATFAAQGAPCKYEYQLSEAITSALRDRIEAEIDANNTLDFRKLDEIRKGAQAQPTLEAGLDWVRVHFHSTDRFNRIEEALDCLHYNGGGIWQLEREKKISEAQKARIEKENPRATFAFFLDDKKLSLCLSLSEWGEGRMYCSNAREYYAHIRALFTHHFNAPMPEALNFLKTEVISAGCFGTEKEGGLTVRLFKNGRLDIEGLDAGKMRELNDMIEKKLQKEHTIVFRKI